MYLERLEAVTGNLLCQLGALSAEQTRKATILQGAEASICYMLASASDPHMHAIHGTCGTQLQWKSARMWACRAACHHGIHGPGKRAGRAAAP